MIKINLPKYDAQDNAPTQIDVWYDRITRLWVAQLKDKDGNQLGNAEYGDKTSILFIVECWERKHNLQVKKAIKKKLAAK